MSECDVHCRYLVGSAPPEAVRRRYDDGVGRLFPDALGPGADALAFALRHPWALGPLDACAALFAPSSLLRHKLLFMLALLETTPELAGWFEPRSAPFPIAVLELAVLGARALVSLAVGLVLWPLLPGRAQDGC